jgi:N-formylglutamate amidohydrolase
MNAPFDIKQPTGHEVPLVLDSPHSGIDYPEDFRPGVGASSCARSEDSFVDELYRSGPAHGATLIARASRAATSTRTARCSTSTPRSSKRVARPGHRQPQDRARHRAHLARARHRPADLRAQAHRGRR